MVVVSRRYSIFLLLMGAASSEWRHRVDAAKLSAYPKYCSKDMEMTAIPPLNDSVAETFGGNVSLAEVELLQVHAMIRHGARGPYTRPRCWKGYDFQWDCNVTEVVSSSLSVDDGGVAVTGLFRKRYDAYPSDNALNGTCMAGQLLDEGYAQEQANGRHLKDAYFCGHKPSCLEGPGATAKDLQKKEALYLRSDDEQRTVMSGQILTASMLDVSDAVLDWHTGDDEYDYLEPNEEACPRLAELSEEALNDPSWTNLTDSPQFKALNDSLTSVWEEEVLWWDVLDCLMTTACTGRELPDELTEDLFEQAANYSTQQYVHESLFNDAAYGKLAMAKLTLEIRERVVGAMKGTSPLKFILLSGHDTTFIPFMAAVAPNAWDKLWPPYATLSTIELLRIGGSSRGAGGVETGDTNEGSDDDGNDELDATQGGSGGGDAAGDYYFRFVYNGEVLKLEGCEQEICAIGAFLNATQFSVDIQEDSDHCCCRNMTQAAVDEYEDNKGSGSGGSVSVSPASTAPNTNTRSPAPTSSGTGMRGDAAVGGVLAPDSTSSASELATGAAGGGDGSDKAAAAAGGAVGIAFACFVIGAIFGGVPALMYFRSFRYEQMRGGGHSYEMT